MKTKLLIFALVISTNLLFGQLTYKTGKGYVTAPTQPNSWWIDKPNTKIDSALLVAKKISHITIIEMTILDSGKWQLDTVGTWTFKYAGDKVASSEWNSWDKKHSKNYLTVTKLKFKKQEIIQVIEWDPSKFRLTSIIDKYGRIIKTENKFIGKARMETEYFFDTIDYSYHNNIWFTNDLPDMAFYVSKEHFVTPNLMYRMIRYNYKQ